MLGSWRSYFLPLLSLGRTYYRINYEKNHPMATIGIFKHAIYRLRLRQSLPEDVFE